VLLEPRVIVGQESALEILGDELDELATRERRLTHASHHEQSWGHGPTLQRCNTWMRAGTDTHREAPASVGWRNRIALSIVTEIVGEPGRVSPEEAELVERLRAGDEATFVELVRLYGPSMLRVAMMYVKTRAVAEEVVQEAWLGVLKGIDRFEGRSSLKTWLFRILTNVAKTRAQREGRSVPFSSLGDADLEPGEPSVDPDRFLPESDPWAGHWTSHPRRFADLPEHRLLSAETMELIERAVDELPETQKIVITMRDIVGCDAEEVCEALGISEVNQRVLLHRARSKVRDALEAYVDA
jgi:RNA polymerase sigma-70 factor (ECF subfamily)